MSLSAQTTADALCGPGNKERTYEVDGTIIAGIPWNGWPNATCWVTLTEWRMGNDVGYGDTQEVQWNDFIHTPR